MNTYKKRFTDSEMKYLIYDLGHNSASMMDFYTCPDTNRMAREVRRKYGIKIDNVEKYEITQYFRMYKLWGLNSCEVINLLTKISARYDKFDQGKPETYLAREWKGYSFPKGKAYRKDYYKRVDFLANAVTYGMRSMDLARLMGFNGGPDAHLHRSKGKELVRMFDKAGTVPSQILQMLELNDRTPLPYLIDEVVGREYQRGWDATKHMPLV